MSKKYIDADELLNRISKLECESPNPKYAQAINDALQGYFPQIINDTPAADVEEARHGCWYNTENGYFCTLCNGDSYAEYDYCPNCGAKMGEPLNTNKTAT